MIADSWIRSFVSVQGALCIYPIATYASEALKKKYLLKQHLRLTIRPYDASYM